MAIAFAASSGTTGTGVLSLTVPAPSSVPSGSCLIAVVATSGGSAVTTTAPSGWTQIQRNANQFGTLELTSFWKITGVSEPTTYSFTFSSTAYVAVGISAYTGTDTSLPAGVSASSSSTATTSPSAPAVTTPSANNYVIRAFGCYVDATTPVTVTPPTGYTERFDRNAIWSAGTASYTSELSDIAQASAGSTGTVTATASASTNYASQTIALQPPLGTYPDTVLADTPFAYWRLQEVSGTSYADSSGNGRTGTMAAAPTWGQTGPFSGDTGVTLSGAAYGSSNGSFTFNNDVSSWECFFKRPDTTTAQGLMSQDGTNTFAVNLTTAGLIVIRNYTSGAAIVTSTSGLTDTNWHHIVATKNGSAVKVYLDKVDVTGTVTNNTLATNNGVFQLGVGVLSTGAGLSCTGTMAEAAVYNVALSATRVAAHYNALLPPTLPGAGGDLEGEVAI